MNWARTVSGTSDSPTVLHHAVDSGCDMSYLSDIERSQYSTHFYHKSYQATVITINLHDLELYYLLRQYQ